MERPEEEMDASILSDVLCEWSISYVPRSLVQSARLPYVTHRDPSRPSIKCKCVHDNPRSRMSSIRVEFVVYWVGGNASKIPNNTVNPNLFDQLYNLSHVLLTENDATERPTNKPRSVTDTSFYPSTVHFQKRDER